MLSKQSNPNFIYKTKNIASKNILDLEKLQRRAASMIKNDEKASL